MKPLFCSALLLLTFSSSAQAPVPLAHGDVPGEPHHHLKIENEYIRAYYVEVPPHEDTQLHQHDHDYLFVTLGATEVINAVLGKPEVKLALRDGEVRFTRGGFAHVARNLGDKPFRNVTIELLRPQGEPKNLCDQVVDGPVLTCTGEVKGLPANSPLRVLPKLGIGPRRSFETDKIAVASYSLSLVGTYNEDFKSPRLLVAEDGPQLHVEIAGESAKSVSNGETVWLDAGKEWKIILPRQDKPTRFLMIRFKDTDSAAKP
jgi:quercetin dioxygenase-like cupin family protein